MSTPLDQGQPFAFEQPWRSSTFSISSFVEQSPLLELELGRLGDISKPQEAELTNDLFVFQSLQLDHPDSEIPSELHELEQEHGLGSALEDPKSQEPTTDVWDFQKEVTVPSSLPSFCTWDSFGKSGDVDVQCPAYVSEAGPAALDAALAQSQPNRTSGVLPQDVSFRALCNLALGRSSVFFQWNASKHCFEQTLLEVPISGLSLQCSAGLCVSLIEYASMYRRLLAVSAPRSVEKTSTLAALKISTTEVLDAIESSISDRMLEVQSLLQLQGILNKPRHLLMILAGLLNGVKDAATDESALSILSDQVSSIAESGDAIVGILQILLARVSLPWLQRLQGDLGLTTGGAMVVGQPADEVQMMTVDDDDSFFDASRPQRLMSRFVSATDRQLIANTKASLFIVRQHLDTSAIAVAMSLPSPDEPESKDSGQRAPTSLPALDMIESDLWLDQEIQQTCLSESNALMDHEPQAAECANDLKTATVAHLADNDSGSFSQIHGSGFLPQFDPLGELRPAIQAQWRSLNEQILRHIFHVCKLREHLDLQHSFQLLGSGEFVAKLSTVLFSADTQSAERTRGNMPTGATMGLRLGARPGQRWPPASSELRLSLMGVLDEAYRNASPHATHIDVQKTDLPGGLSFAIRELSDAEIDRVVDPTSLYALDFLKLQFAAPAPLDAVMTAASVQKYDEIFRFLLQLLRVEYVTAQLRKECITRSGERDAATSRVSLEIHHVVSVIMRYVMDIGISTPWRTFMAQIDRIEKALGSEVLEDLPANMSLTGLRELHDTCLDSIRSRLFLKRKHAKLRDTISDVLRSILASISTFSGEEGSHGLSQIRKSVTTVIEMLQETVSKPSRAAGGRDATEFEIEPLKILLSQLDWNHFYGVCG